MNNFFRQNQNLTTALTVSALGHFIVLIGVGIVAPDVFKIKPADPKLEVILNNGGHDKEPVNAQALAQTNLDGGGNADDGRAKSPLPDMHRIEEGDSLEVQRRRQAELEKLQEKLLAQATAKNPLVVAPDKNILTESSKFDGADKDETTAKISRSVAEIAKNIEDYNKRPRITQITPSTKKVGYARYYMSVRAKIEKLGTLHFPQKDGVPLHGELIIYIQIFQDGRIYDRDGGPRVEKSSGIPELDKAALRIVMDAAPFGRFPTEMRSNDRDDVWGVTTRFKFTNEEELETELRGGTN